MLSADGRRDAGVRGSAPIRRKKAIRVMILSHNGPMLSTPPRFEAKANLDFQINEMVLALAVRQLWRTINTGNAVVNNLEIYHPALIVDSACKIFAPASR